MPHKARHCSVEAYSETLCRAVCGTRGGESSLVKRRGLVLRLWLLTCGVAGSSPGRTHTLLRISLEKADLSRDAPFVSGVHRK